RVSIPRSRAEYGSAIQGGGAGPVKTTPCTFQAGEAIPTQRYDRAGLDADRAISGPAIIEDAWSTVILPPGASLTPDRDGHLHIETGVAP
ncbi:MAG: hydantoinase/oxoprolinase family protein, partial [Alphaproteobacteria bacterium]|nr:hydantoinase/oxoprolinase family protein [Alphaproteobacteria bacterium]